MDLHDTMAKKHEKGTVLSTKTKTIPQNKIRKSKIKLYIIKLQRFTALYKSF